MKNLIYLVVVMFGLMAASCTEESVTPHAGEDDPIVIPPPKH